MRLNGDFENFKDDANCEQSFQHFTLLLNTTHNGSISI